MMSHRNPSTFLPPPHCDGVIRFHSNWEQKLSRGTEVDIANPFSMGAAKDGQCLLGHCVPHMDRWSHSCDKRSELNRPDNDSNRISILQRSTCPGPNPGDSNSLHNNRPISICLAISKIAEKWMWAGLNNICMIEDNLYQLKSADLTLLDLG